MSRVEIRSLSRANDASLLALSDLAAVADRIELEHRVIGGQMVALHVALAGVTNQVPDRATADADAGVARTAVTGDKLAEFIKELGALDYRKVSGDRLYRERDGTAIDVLLPAYRTRPRTNVRVGPVTATEAGGLTYALGRAPETVSVTATLTDGKQLPPFAVHVPTIEGALAIKAHAWAHRGSPRDALDIWRLLHAAEQRGVRPDHWCNTRTLERAAGLLRTDFRLATSAGTIAAAAAPRDRALVASLTLRVVG